MYIVQHILRTLLVLHTYVLLYYYLHIVLVNFGVFWMNVF